MRLREICVTTDRNFTGMLTKFLQFSERQCAVWRFDIDTYMNQVVLIKFLFYEKKMSNLMREFDGV